MKIEDLELFTTIVRLGGFTAAANALDLPRSNVSRRINRLEEELSVPLFFRTTRQLSLTQYGKVYHEEVIKALAVLERAKQATTHVSTQPKGKLKIGILPETSEATTPILFNFIDKYPDIELDIRSINNGFVDTYQQDLDLAFHAGDIIDSNLVAKNLAGINRHIVASPEYIAQFGLPKDPEALLDRNCICFRWPNGQVDNDWVVNGKALALKGNITSNSIGLIKQTVLSGRGIGFLPRILINKELKEGQLLSLLPDCEDNFQNERIWLLYPETKAISHAAKVLIEYLAQEVPKIA